MELLSHMVTLCITFWRLPNCFPKQLYHFTFPPAVYEDSNFYVSLPPLVIVCHFDYCHPSEYGVMSHCCFDLHFPDTAYLFIYLLVIFTSALEKYLFWSFAHLTRLFIFLLLSCKSSLSILDTSPLFDIWFENAFSHTVCCLFTFLRCHLQQRSF